MSKSIKSLEIAMRAVARTGGISRNEAMVCAALASGKRGVNLLARSTGLAQTAVGNAVRGLKHKGVIAYRQRRGVAAYSEVEFLG